MSVGLAATITAGGRADPPLTPPQVRALTVIADARGGLSVTSVATALSASAPSASRLCQRLARDGLLDRGAGPGNQLRLSLSPAGHATLEAINRDRLAQLGPLLDALPPARRRRAEAALRDLGDQI